MVSVQFARATSIAVADLREYKISRCFAGLSSVGSHNLSCGIYTAVLVRFIVEPEHTFAPSAPLCWSDLTLPTRLTHCLFDRADRLSLALGNMSTLSGQADLHRILSREEEPHIKHSLIVKAQEVSPDPVYLDHLGAHFPTGSRKDSFPVYPDGVEVSEDEGAAQPDSATIHSFGSITVQYRHGGLGKSSSDPSTRDLTHDRFSISPEEFVELQRQRSGECQPTHDSREQMTASFSS